MSPSGSDKLRSPLEENPIEKVGPQHTNAAVVSYILVTSTTFFESRMYFYGVAANPTGKHLLQTELIKIYGKLNVYFMLWVLPLMKYSEV